MNPWLRKQMLALILLSLLFPATTYVIQENGREVGRYEERDGRDEVVLVEQAVDPAVNQKSGEVTEALRERVRRQREQTPLHRDDPADEEMREVMDHQRRQMEQIFRLMVALFGALVLGALLRIFWKRS